MDFSKWIRKPISQVASRFPQKERTGAITAYPNPFIMTDLTGLGVTTIVWASVGTDMLEVHADAPDGPLVSRSGPSGSATTGKWVHDGSVFYLQDVTGGLPLTPENTLAKVEVSALFDGDPETGRLLSLPRYQSAVTNVLGMPFEIVDASSFIDMYNKFFVQEIHCFKAHHDEPYIIDGGANIGLSLFYFKKIYPLSEIVAFEADERIFPVLERNVAQSGYDGITLVCAALSASESVASFLDEGSWAGRIARADDPHVKYVKTVRLREYLNREVDLVKLSIEGAETDVVRDCSDLLGCVDKMVVEYHSFAQETQTLHILLGVLAEAGFRIHIKQFSSASQPFLNRDVYLGKDQILYVYAFRD